MSIITRQGASSWQRKPTLQHLCERHATTPFALAHASNGLRLMLVWAVYVNRGVSQQTAMRVLTAFNRYCKTSYTLRELDICIKGE